MGWLVIFGLAAILGLYWLGAQVASWLGLALAIAAVAGLGWLSYRISRENDGIDSEYPTSWR